MVSCRSPDIKCTASKTAAIAWNQDELYFDDRARLQCIARSDVAFNTLPIPLLRLHGTIAITRIAYVIFLLWIFACIVRAASVLGFTYDDIGHLWMSGVTVHRFGVSITHDLFSIFIESFHDTHPPLRNILLSIWFTASSSLLTIRLLFITAYASCAFGLWLLLRELRFTQEIRLLVLIHFLLAKELIFLSIQTRGYLLMLTFLLLATTYVIRSKRTKTLQDSIIAHVFAALAILTEYQAFFFIAPLLFFSSQADAFDSSASNSGFFRLRQTSPSSDCRRQSYSRPRKLPRDMCFGLLLLIGFLLMVILMRDRDQITPLDSYLPPNALDRTYAQHWSYYFTLTRNIFSGLFFLQDTWISETFFLLSILGAGRMTRSDHRYIFLACSAAFACGIGLDFLGFYRYEPTRRCLYLIIPIVLTFSHGIELIVRTSKHRAREIIIVPLGFTLMAMHFHEMSLLRNLDHYFASYLRPGAIRIADLESSLQFASDRTPGDNGVVAFLRNSPHFAAYIVEKNDMNFADPMANISLEAFLSRRRCKRGNVDCEKGERLEKILHSLHSVVFTFPYGENAFNELVQAVRAGHFDFASDQNTYIRAMMSQMSKYESYWVMSVHRDRQEFSDEHPQTLDVREDERTLRIEWYPNHQMFHVSTVR